MFRFRPNNKSQNFKLIAKVLCLSIPIYALLIFAGYELKLSIDIMSTIDSDNNAWKVNYDSKHDLVTDLCHWNPGDCNTSCNVNKPCVDLKKGYNAMAIMTIVSIVIIFTYFLTSTIYSLCFLFNPSNKKIITGLSMTTWITFISLYGIYMAFYIFMIITLYDYEFDFSKNHANIQQVDSYILRIGNSETVNSLKYYWTVTSIGWLLTSCFCVFGIFPAMGCICCRETCCCDDAGFCQIKDNNTGEWYCCCRNNCRTVCTLYTNNCTGSGCFGGCCGRCCCYGCCDHCCKGWSSCAYNDERFSQTLFTENLLVDCVSSLLIITPYIFYCIYSEFAENCSGNTCECNSPDKAGNPLSINVQSATPSVDVNCVVCLTTLKSIMVLPCSHVLYCADCHKGILANKIDTCSVCRGKVSSTQSVYI